MSALYFVLLLYGRRDQAVIHGPAKQQLSDQDWAWLERLAQAGNRSILGFSFYSPDTWSRILSLGYKDIVLRLWHDRGSLPHPGIYYAQYESYIWTLRGMCQIHGATLAVAPVNEANLELPDQTAAEVAQWYGEWALRIAARMPSVELLSPSISPTHPGAWDYLQALRSAFRHADTLSIHFYWRDNADLNPGAGWSPEWWRGQFPTMPQRLTEVGGADGTSRDWRYQTYYEMLSRYEALGYVRSQHVFVMSSDDDHWAQLGHTYDERIIEILGDVGKLGGNQSEEVTMLKDEYPNEFAAWNNAGGVDNNFRDHLLGIGAIKPTLADIAHLADQTASKVSQLKNALAAIPK